jgi:hypothetical protein
MADVDKTQAVAPLVGVEVTPVNVRDAGDGVTKAKLRIMGAFQYVNSTEPPPHG